MGTAEWILVAITGCGLITLSVLVYLFVKELRNGRKN